MEEIQERKRVPNPHLKRQREIRGWSRGHMVKELQKRFPEVAVTDNDIARWENGKRRPGPYYREKLCVLFQTTADKLGFIPQDVSFEHNGEEGEVDRERKTTPSQPCHTEVTRDILESTDSHHSDIQESDKELSLMDRLRRAINKAVGATLVGVNLQVITTPLILSEDHTGLAAPPEEYIPQCTLIVESCWEWLNQANYHKVERALQRTMPTLRRCANTRGPYQNIAASLAVQANIMQNQLATLRLDYGAREGHCVEAVHFGGLSDNPLMLALAQYWYGDTFTYCYDQPQRATLVLNDALKGLGSGTSLIRSAIYSDLSIAHAQDKDERSAAENERLSREYAEAARLAIPNSPELDPLYKCVRMGSSELDQFEGKSFLYLAERTHNRSYAELARNAFEKSISKQANAKDYLGQAYIRRADAARALGDMDGFVMDLTDGFRIGVEIDSMQRFIEANSVIGDIPPEWKQETAVQELQKDISHAIMIARR